MDILFFWTVLQTAGETIVNWPEIAALFINGVLVMVLFQFLKNKGLVWLKEKVPWLMPLLPSAAGFALSWLSDYLFTLLGYPIDFSPIMGLLSGTFAVQGYEVVDRAFPKVFKKKK